MSRLDCCRTCLSEISLKPIFNDQEMEDKYATIYNLITGITMSLKDEISTKICTNCVQFINDSIAFRNVCAKSNETLKGSFVINKTDEQTDRQTSNVCIIDNFKEENELDNLTDYEESIPIENKKKIKKQNKQVITLNDPKETDENTHNISKNSADNIKCDICNKIVKINGFKKHYKRHTGLDIVCEHCGKSFISRGKLLGHCRAKHGYEKKDKCSFCDYTASNIELVKIHERLHTGEKPYICKVCGMGFHRNSTYIQHLPVHSDEKSVQCDQCPSMFKSVSLMRIHKHKRHKLPKYTYKCAICNNNFARRYNVVKHLKRIHYGFTERFDVKHVERINV